jgi:hypothetical protein
MGLEFRYLWPENVGYGRTATRERRLHMECHLRYL